MVFDTNENNTDGGNRRQQSSRALLGNGGNTRSGGALLRSPRPSGRHSTLRYNGTPSSGPSFSGLSDPESTLSALSWQADSSLAQAQTLSLPKTLNEAPPFLKNAADPSAPSPIYLQSGSRPQPSFESPISTTLVAPRPVNLLTDPYRDGALPPEDISNWAHAHIAAEPGIHPPRWETYLSKDWPSSLSETEHRLINTSLYQDSQSLRLADQGKSTHQTLGPYCEEMTFPSECLSCDKSDTIYRDLSAWRIHFWTTHWMSVPWSPSKCLWDGCLLDKVFKTHKLWLGHARNVHQKEFWCTVSGCKKGFGSPNGKPFGTKAMLNRHNMSKHSKEQHCTKAGCQGRKSSNLSRPDKYKEHQARWHGPLMCEFVSCPRRRVNGFDHGFSGRDELDKHMQEKHHRRRAAMRNER